MRLSKISLTWIRIASLSLVIVILVILISRRPFVQELIPKMRAPALTATEEQWNLKIEKVYSFCGHHDIVNQKYFSLKNLKSAVENKHGLMLKKSFGNHYVYEITVAEYCPNCCNHQFLGIRKQNVAVIRGTPIMPGPVLEKIQIKLEKLPSLELEDLRKGIPFKTGSEKLQLIEGLKGLITN